MGAPTASPAAQPAPQTAAPRWPAGAQTVRSPQRPPLTQSQSISPPPSPWSANPLQPQTTARSPPRCPPAPPCPSRAPFLGAAGLSARPGASRRGARGRAPAPLPPRLRHRPLPSPSLRAGSRRARRGGQAPARAPSALCGAMAGGAARQRRSRGNSPPGRRPPRGQNNKKGKKAKNVFRSLIWEATLNLSHLRRTVAH